VHFPPAMISPARMDTFLSQVSRTVIYDLTGGDGYVSVSSVQDGDNKYRGYTSIDDDSWQLERAQRYRMGLFDMHKPVVAKIHGYCLAGGTDLPYCAICLLRQTMRFLDSRRPGTWALCLIICGCII